LPFAEIVGQDRAIRVVRRALAAGTVPHAWLFFGPEGVGKFKTALAVAKALLCGQTAADDFCGSCTDCGRVDNEAHPDVLVLRAESKKGDREGVGGGQETGEIRIEQVRQFQRWAAVARV
jgi:DNA polymerase-3 subunit delta'